MTQLNQIEQQVFDQAQEVVKSLPQAEQEKVSEQKLLREIQIRNESIQPFDHKFGSLHGWQSLAHVAISDDEILLARSVYEAMGIDLSKLTDAWGFQSEELLLKALAVIRILSDNSYLLQAAGLKSLALQNGSDILLES